MLKGSSAQVWFCSMNVERNAPYLLTVGAGMSLVVGVSMVMVSISLMLCAQNSLSVIAVNERSGVRCPVGASEGFFAVEVFFSSLLLLMCSSSLFS